MDSCPQGGRVAGDGRPLPVLHAGTPQTSGSRRKGVLDKTKRQRPVQARQGHRKLIPGTKKTPSRCELQGGLERSLAAAYFPT